MSESEQNMLKKRVQRIKEELGDQDLPEQPVKNKPEGKNGMWVKDRVRFKRKKAKVRNNFHVLFFLL